MSWRARVLGLLEAIADIRPSAIALSRDLPGGDPIELVRAIRAHERWRDVEVFLIGAKLPRELELRAYVEGADAVLTRERAIPEISARLLGRSRPSGGGRRGGEPPVDARAVADAALDLCVGEGWRPTPPDRPVGSGGHRPAFELIDVAGADRDRASTAPPTVGPAPASILPFEAPDPGVPDLRPTEEPTILPIGVSRPSSFTGGGGGGVAGIDLRSRTRPATPTVVPDVVIVEDDAALLEMLRYALANRGYQTLSFSNGLDALRALREMDTAGRKPVVLLDVDLPGIDGFRILHELSGSRPGDYQIILSTVHNSEATQVLGIQSGAVDYLVKPLRMPVVLAKIERLAGQGSFDSAARG